MSSYPALEGGGMEEAAPSEVEVDMGSYRGIRGASGLSRSNSNEK